MTAITSHYLYNGNTVKILSAKDMISKPTLENGTYELCYSQEQGFYLNKIQDMLVPEIVYGDYPEVAKRVITTYTDRGCNTGVLLEGEQGSGKTMLAKIISNALRDINIPTVVINKAYYGPSFNTFMASLDCPCLIFFDEFEKTYMRNDEKEAILTFFDGVFDSNKLIICTVNDKARISNYMLNRPGRLYYLISYNRLTTEAIKEYTESNLKDKSQINNILNVSITLGGVNFDMLKAIVEEMNRYDISVKEAIKYLNIQPSFTTFDTGVSYFVLGVNNSDEYYISKTSYKLAKGEYRSHYGTEVKVDKEKAEYIVERLNSEIPDIETIKALINTKSSDDETERFVRNRTPSASIEEISSFYMDTGVVITSNDETTCYLIPYSKEDLAKLK